MIHYESNFFISLSAEYPNEQIIQNEFLLKMIDKPAIHM